MIHKPTTSHSVGVHQSGEHLLTASLVYVKGEVKVEQLKRVDVKPLYTPDESITVSGVDARDILIRSLRVGLTKKEDIFSVLPFESESLFPFSSEEGAIDGQIIDQTEEHSDLAVTGLKADALEEHLEKLKDWEFEPEVVSTIPAALAAFAQQYTESDEDSIAIISVEQTLSTLVISQRGHAIGAKSLPFGSDQLTKEDHLEGCQMQFTQAYLSLTKQMKSKAPKTLLVTESTLDKELVNKLTSEVKLSPLQLSGELPKYAIPIGLALQALPGQPGQINFRQGEFRYPHPWRRSKKNLAVFAGSATLLAVIFYLFSATTLDRYEMEVREAYVDLLTAIQKSPEQVDVEYRNKVMGIKTTQENSMINLKEISMEEVTNWTSFINQEVSKGGEPFPLHPNTPRVSDFLAWISTHPNVVQGGLESTQRKALLDITSVNYVMVKRPDETRKRERYQVRVEMEFISESARNAREFHDALLEPNAFIDPREEVKWTSNRDVYRVSMFLKDQTFYPG